MEDLTQFESVGEFELDYSALQESTSEASHMDLEEDISEIESEMGHKIDEVPKAEIEPEAEPEAPKAEAEEQAEPKSETETESEEPEAPSLESFEWKGEQYEASKEDLYKAYHSFQSGNKEIARRFSELDVEKKQYEAQTQQINGYMDTFLQKLNGASAIEAAQYMTEFSGSKISPHQFKEQLIRELAPELERRSMMTEDQLRSEYLQEENKYFEEKRQLDEQRWQQEQSQRELDMQYRQAQIQYGKSDEDFDTAVEALREAGLQDADITPERMSQYWQDMDTVIKAEELVSSISEELLSHEDDVVLQVARTMMNNPGWSLQDHKAWAEGKWGSVAKEESKVLSAKIKQTSPAAKGPSKEEIEEAESAKWADILADMY